METLGPSTELQAVNELLASIGTDPVEDLENMPPDGNLALHVLRSEARTFQEEDYWFNRETDVALQPDETGTIYIPDGALEVDASDGSDAIPRGNRLYDRESKTYTFTGPVLCTVVYQRPWDELPSVVRRYVTALSVETFCGSTPGAPDTTPARQRNLNRAQLAFLNRQIEMEDYNLLSNSSIATLIPRS